MDIQTEWEAALAKSKQAVRPKNLPSLDIQKKQIDEELTYFKTQLREAIKERDKNKANEHLTKLFDIRAKQTTMALNEMTENNYILDQEMVDKQVDKYYRDCYQLSVVVDNMLSSKQPQ